MEETQAIVDKYNTMTQVPSAMNAECYDVKFYDNLRPTEIYFGKTGTTWRIDEGDQVKVKAQGEPNKAMLGSILVKCSKLDKYFANGFGNIHGAAMVTWLDCLTTVALMAFDPKGKPSMSLSLSANFMNSASIKDTPIYFNVKILKMGRTVGFTEVDILDKNFKIVCSMTHNKAFVSTSKMAKM